MIHINWSTTAFAMLESLPAEIAFDILDYVDLLSSFPELGTPLGQLSERFGNCRQLIFKRHYRIVYLYESETAEIKLQVLQHCRQQLPMAMHLHRALKEIEQKDHED